MKKWALAFLAIISLPSLLLAISAEEIIEKLEANMVTETSRVDGAMIIRDRFGTKESTFISHARGTDDMLIEFTSVEEEGMKILRTRDELYLFFPEAEEVIRMQGAALKEAVIGSDMSYEDMTGGKSLLKSYMVKLEGFIYRKVHKFSRSGKLLKEIIVDDIRKVSGKYVPFHMVLKDTMKGNSSTDFIVRDMEIDIPLKSDLFSLEELTW
jgi:outer membrane lipoprotein-sorting protein